MNNIEMIFAGFGGQGVLSMAKFLAYGALNSNFNVSWMPSYGPEMRGGTANCSLIISDSEISSPIITKPQYVIAMNTPSFKKFQNVVLVNGALIYNSDIIEENLERTDIKYIPIPIQTLALNEINKPSTFNMIMLGALVRLINNITIEKLIESFDKYAGRKIKTDDNIKALKFGYNYINF